MSLYNLKDDGSNLGQVESLIYCDSDGEDLKPWSEVYIGISHSKGQNIISFERFEQLFLKIAANVKDSIECGVCNTFEFEPVTCLDDLRVFTLVGYSIKLEMALEKTTQED